MRLSDLYGNNITERDRLKDDTMFNLRCCIPCIVQSYNSENGTIECQPAIRERIINQNEEIEYRNIPLLINVPIAFPSSGNWQISFPISKGDECLVFFSDLSIDNFWLKGNVQNPIEDRRHDLSDGIAIPCNLSLTKSRRTDEKGILISSENASILIEDGEITFTRGTDSVTLTQILNHIHYLGELPTTKPFF